MKIFFYTTLFALAGLTCAAADNGLPASGVEPERPLDNNMNSIMILSNSKLVSNVIVLYNSLASKNRTKGSLKAAEETLLKKSIPLSIRYGNDRTNYNCFMALATCYADQKKYTQAKWYFIQSNISAKKAGYSRGEVLSLVQLAKLKRLIGDHRLALDDFREAEKLAERINFKSELPGIRKSIASFGTAEKTAEKIAGGS
ncbi:MAG TPA: tetratricopeptide repeat protein [Sphingobacteriaceae bacterium]